jgi:hypothetical protein
MEDSITKTQSKSLSNFDSVRVRPQNKTRFNKLLAGANKKESGGKIVADDLFGIMLDKITTKDLQQLQQQSLRNEDRIELLRRAYIKARGPITKDDFFGFTLSSEFPTFLQQHGAGIVAKVGGEQ